MKKIRLLFWLSLLATPLAAALQLGSPFTDHAVLQRDQPVAVWGWADAGATVTVTFAGQTKSAIADAKGAWCVTLDPLDAAAEPRALTVAQGSETRTLADLLVGEVWLASGQSNMVFTLSKSRYRWAGVIDEEAEIAAADYPLIRMFTAGEQKSHEPQATVPGEWQVCTPANAPAWSAIGYFFARDLHRELGVPVGIVTAAYGASCAHAWIRRAAMLDDPAFKAVLDRFDEQVRGHTEPTAAEIADWERAVELAKAENRRPPRRPGQSPIQDQHNPTVMFNGMIAPLVPYAVRGFLWYQGESITSPRELFPRWNARLIADWRQLWGGETKPFLFCQLAALANNSNSPQVRAWQAEALREFNTGMAVTIDVGDEKDVHPHDKAPVGHRLALLALTHAYGRQVESSGPVCVDAIATTEGAARLRFDHATGGLVAKGGALQTFEIAGPDGNFTAAEAAIDGDAVIVRSGAVSAPAAVRYAWANYPAGCNLYNGAGLPAAPFSVALSAR